jgi:hypothetical protein
VPQEINDYQSKAAAPAEVVLPDRAAAAVVADQYGVITVRQLNECGLRVTPANGG